MLASCFETKDGGTGHDSINRNDERQHHHRLFGGHVGHSNMAPSIQSMWPGLVHLVTWHCHIVLVVVVLGDGCAWWWPLVTAARWEGVVDDGGG